MLPNVKHVVSLDPKRVYDHDEAEIVRENLQKFITKKTDKLGIR